VQQTKVQEANTIRVGSAMVEVGDDVGSLVNLGAMTGVTFEESWDTVEIESDNAGTIRTGVSNHTAGVNGELQEINLSKISNIRGGIDNFENIAGSTVSGETQTVTSGNWDFDKFIKIEHQNGDGSKPSNISVSASTAGSLTEDTDFYVMQNELGEWGIIINDESANITSTDQDITITYDYTPNEAVKLTSGGKTSINPKVIRLTNKDENGNKFQITIFKAKNQEGISIDFPTDQSGEVATAPINLQGELDETRDVGAQLFEIYDEQGVV